MFKKKKNSISFLFILGLLLLSGCHKSPSPSCTALNYYALIIKQNILDTASLGLSDETAQNIVSHIKEDLHTQISEKLSMNGRINIDPTKIIELEEAYLASLQKLHATASEHKEDTYYLVTLSTSYIDYAAIDEWAIRESLTEVNISHFSDEVLYLTTLTDAYITHLLAGYQNAEPATTYHEANFIFTLQNGLWLPKDYDAFVTTLCDLVGNANKEL